ncbi:MAG: flagellar filament capping protein FliD [Planctomyces sp.]|nr:flagellar filament capping protein FliD [Planctomyces sp.]
MPAIDGLITGIDTESIITDLLKIRQTRIDVLKVKQQGITDKKSAFQKLEAQIISLRSQASQLARSQNNVFSTRTVSTSHESALAATATSAAAVGTFQVQVHSLAQSHQVASQGFADPDSEITAGTFEFRVGSGPVQTVTIDSTNNTLQGLATAINSSGAGVFASIVRDSSDPSAPNRLMLSAGKSGAANQISVTNNLAASSGGAVRPDFDFDNPIQSAADARVQLGSGPGAIVASSDTNTVTGLLEGVTLNLREADPARTITINVAQNTEGAVKAVQDFVTAYNDLMTQFDTQFRYVPESNQVGVLLGNRIASDLQAQIRDSVLGVVPGVNSRMNRMSAIGVSVTDRGHLTFNPSKLTDALTGKVPGVSADDVRKLFALDASSDNGGVQFVIGGTRTGAPASGVQVDITQAAERATISAGSALAPSTVIDGTNDTLSLRLDGTSATEIRLAHGTYTPDQLAAHLESVINSTPAFGTRQVAAGVSGGALTLTSVAYGAASEIAVVSGTAMSALGFLGNESDFGQDVAGVFIVDGQTEPAAGRGRLLIGNADNPNTADLQVRVTLSSGQVQAGVDANLTTTRGLASRLDQALNKLLDPVNGRIKTVHDSFDANLETLQKAIDRQNAFFEKQQKKLIDEFTALEMTMAQLQNTATYLTNQLAPNQNKS